MSSDKSAVRNTQKKKQKANKDVKTAADVVIDASKFVAISEDKF